MLTKFKTNIKNLSKTIEDELKELQIEIVPIIVSAKPVDTVKQKAKGQGVHVIDGNDLKTIVEKLYEGPPRPDLLLKPLNDKTTFQNFGMHY